jgi:hypothetical protein
LTFSELTYKHFKKTEIFNLQDNRTQTRGSKMSETTKEPTFPKKMVSLNVAIALGIICIILIALIAYFTVTGIPAQNSYTNLQNQNKQLTSTLDLGKSTTLVNDVTVSEVGGAYGWEYPSNVLSYAGYISVWVLSSTMTNTYVRVAYSSLDINCNDSVMVGSSGIAVVPVLPASVLPT